MGRIDGVITVVTGADGPEGAAAARALAGAGARAVVLCGREGGALGSLARELEAGGCRAAVFLGDAAASADELAELVHELFVAREQESQESARRPSRPGR